MQSADAHRATKEAGGHSLWLIPPGALYERLSRVIKQLAVEYKTPVFEPHLTLLNAPAQSNDVALSKSILLASGQKPVTVNLGGALYSDSYFMSFFLEVESTVELQTLHDHAAELFSMPRNTRYMPHISLLYGFLSRSTKEKLAKSIEIDCGSNAIFTSMHLFRTEGEPRAWHRIEEIPFT